MNPSAIVTLLTDFGTSDGYVAAMKGSMLRIAPRLTLVDMSHQIAPQAVAEAAFVLASTYRYFPQGTVHLVVVDPGVGSARRAIAAHIDHHLFVAPDNGVLTPILNNAATFGAVSLTRPDYWRSSQVSATFHGRDILAPVAAHLACGAALAEVGEWIDDLHRLDWPAAQILPDGALAGQVVHVDHFGNLITNIPGTHLAQGARLGRIQVGRLTLEGLQPTYAAVPTQSCLALIGSHGFLEIAIRDGHAARTLGLGAGADVRVT